MKQFYIFLVIACTSFSTYAQKPLVWKFATEAGVYSSPVLDESSVYIGSNDSCLYVLNKADGIVHATPRQ